MITSSAVIRSAALATALAAVSLTCLAGSPAAPARASVGRATVSHPVAATTQPTAIPRPPGRRWASFAYDPPRHELVLFGGESLNSVYGDTWIRKEGMWTEEQPAHSPTAREGSALVYDTATRQLLLFGGYSPAFPHHRGYMNGTWVWNGATWRRLNPASSPSPRHNADMVYDAATRDVILFGGYDGHYLGDTWSWNGTTWTRLSPAASPSRRDSESLAYDAQTQTAIMFGGFNDTRLSDTWSWNGTTWTELSPAASPGVITTAWMTAYDAATQQLLLFGGDPGDAQPPANGTWVWTGTTWTQLSPALSPRGRVYGTMTYDSADHHVVLFGGAVNGSESKDPNTTWVWTGSTWIQGG
jgi:hypothetical protein